MRKAAAILALFCCLFMPSRAVNAGEPPTVVETDVKQVALFKNGYGFFSCQGDLPRGQQRIVLDRVPHASLGTLWYGTAGGDARIVDAKVIKRAVPLERPATNFEELIRSNPGALVEVVTDRDVVGTLLPVPEDFTYPDSKPFVSIPPEIMHSRRMPFGYGGVGAGSTQARAEIFMVRTDDRVITLRFSDVRQLALSADSKTVFTEKQEQSLLECGLDKPAEAGCVYLHYLQAGASWIPAYEIQLIDDTNAAVLLKGTLVNDVEDLEGVEVRFIVGYPNFMFADVEDPLSGRSSLREFLEWLSTRSMREGARRAAIEQQMLSNVGQFDFRAGGAMLPIPVMPGEGEFKEDLFYYPPVTATAKKGERLAFVLSESKVPYQHIYTWDIADTIPLDTSGTYGLRQRAPQEAEEEQEVIWHCLRLENQAKQPWTTGSALIMQDGLPLGQDMMKYTSVGSETIVRITKATDVVAQKQELEIGREPNAGQFYHGRYDLVTVRGELKLRNKRTESVHVAVTKTTTGLVDQTAPQAEVTVRAEGLRPVNQLSTLKWEVDVEPGQEQELTYVVEVYVRT